MPKLLRPRREFPTPLFKVALPLLVAAAIGLGIWLGARHHRATADPPLFVPWRRVGDIVLGEPRDRVLREYGRDRVTQTYDGAVETDFRLHGSTLYVSYFRGRVSAIGFSTPYYRTRSGFGVGSRMPSGARRWHGFIYNPRLREEPCSCWVKVGLGAQSLAISSDNFLKPWLFVDVRRGRVTRFYFDLRYVD